ncbi:uncharacterized protein J3R85_003417 [Psidium guajava]|nr:uncharacterized protein J3R85_003417 [Psidium guajava]
MANTENAIEAVCVMANTENAIEAVCVMANTENAIEAFCVMANTESAIESVCVVSDTGVHRGTPLRLSVVAHMFLSGWIIIILMQILWGIPSVWLQNPSPQ